MSVAGSDGGDNPVVNEGAPTPAATPPDQPLVVDAAPSPGGGLVDPPNGGAAIVSAPPGPVQDYQDLDGLVEAHLSQLEEGWSVSRVVRWQGEFLVLLAGYPYSNGYPPHELVASYLHRLRNTLRGRGCRAETVAHYLRQFQQLANAPGAPPHEGGAVGPTYMAVTGADPDDPTDPGEWGMYRLDGDRPVRLCNFVLFIDAQVSVADEIAPDTRLTGRVVMGSVQRPITISTADYSSNNGLQEAIYNAAGVRAQIFSRIEEVRNAVAAVSSPEARTVTTDSGWTDTFDAYRVQSGVITAAGFRGPQPDEPRVDLSNEEHARRLDFRFLNAEELARVKRHIRDDLFCVHDPRVILVLLATVGLAVLYPRARGVKKFTLWLTGLTGCGKTFLALVFQNFYGFWSAHDGLPNFSCTVNFLEREGYYYRHALYVVDDYKPDVTQRHHVVRLLQSYSDSSSRGRLRSDATANASRPIRGWLLGTGEDTIEHTSSALARSVVVTVPNLVKDIERGARCMGESANYSGVTADFIRWLLAYGGLDRFARRVEDLRARYYQDIAGHQNDGRIAANFALLGAAGELILEYFSDVLPEARAIAQRFLEVDLVELRNAALIDVHEEQESETFLRILAELVNLGRVQVFGYKPKDVPQPGDQCPVVGHRRRRVGARGNTQAVLEHFELCARTCLEHVNQALARQGAGQLKVTEKALLRQLRHDGLLLDEAGQPLGVGAVATRATRVDGHPVRCFRISQTALLGASGRSSDGDEPGPLPAQPTT